MSKTVGYILLLGLLGSVILSIALLMWVFIQSNNSNEGNKNATPTIHAGQLRQLEAITVALVDTRQLMETKAISGWLLEFSTAGFTSNFEVPDLACA